MAAGYTQEALAEAARLSARCISDLERGIRRAPHRNTVELLAGALRLSQADRAVFEVCARSHPAPGSSGSSGSSGSPSQLGEPPAHVHSAHPPLVGRRADLAAVERFLREGPPVLFITGEPGIGKTRLLQAAAECADGSGWRVLRGGTQRLGGLAPYVPVVGALSRFIARRTPAERREDLRGCGWLVRLLPELSDTLGASPAEWAVPAEQERRLMFAAVARFLENVAGSAGTLLVLDDLQWAGSDAHDLLVMLARSAAESSLRILCAYRDTDVRFGDPLAVTLADLAHAGIVDQAQLGPLSQDESAELLRSLLPDERVPALTEQVLRQCGGVPFFLVSSALALQSAGPERDASSTVPWNVAQSVNQRVAALPSAAHDLLSAASVVGRIVSRPLLLALAARAGYNEAAALDALDAATQARLLVEEGGDRYQFAHELIREVIVSGLGAARRSVLHRYVAEALEARDNGRQPALLAYHFDKAGEQEKTLLYLERAGDRADAMHARGAAERYYRDLIARLDALGQGTRAARVREKLGAVLMTAARYDAALNVFEVAIASYRLTDDLEGICRATAQIGWVHALRGTPDEGIARLQPLPNPLNTSRLSSLGLAQLYVALAQLYSASGRYSEQLNVSERAAKLATAVKAPLLLAQAEMRYGTALLMLGRMNEGFRVLDGAIPAIEATGDLRNLCWAINNIGVVYEVRGEFATTRRHVERAVELAERLADPTVLAFMVHRRGINAFYMGDWESARADLERSLALLHGVPTSATATYPPLGLGTLLLACGDVAAAERSLAEADALARPRGDLQAINLIHSLLAERELLEGRAVQARDRLLQLCEEGACERSDAVVLLPRLAWAYLQLGELEQAEAIVGRAVSEATAEHNRFDLVDGLTVRALLELRLARFDAAERTLDAALTLTRDMRYPYGEARVLFAFGQLHAEKGERDMARDRLLAALAVLRRLGERLYTGNVEALLADLAPTSVAAR